MSSATSVMSNANERKPRRNCAACYPAQQGSAEQLEKHGVSILSLPIIILRSIHSSSSGRTVTKALEADCPTLHRTGADMGHENAGSACLYDWSLELGSSRFKLYNPSP